MTNYLLRLKISSKLILNRNLTHYLEEAVGSKIYSSSFNSQEELFLQSMTLDSNYINTVYSFSSNKNFEECEDRIDARLDQFKIKGLEYELINCDETLADARKELHFRIFRSRLS